MIKSETGEMVIEIGRFNEPNRKVTLSENSTLQDVLDELSITLNDNESLWVDGEAATAADILEDGDTVQIVGNKEGGLK